MGGQQPERQKLYWQTKVHLRPKPVYLILENTDAPKETLLAAFFLELKIKNEFFVVR
jgi:hypothetical protein